MQSALKNVQIRVCHRETHQRFRVYSLTEGATEDPKFWERSGKEYKLVDYFRDKYYHEIEFKNLPCLQISRSKRHVIYRWNYALFVKVRSFLVSFLMNKQHRF